MFHVIFISQVTDSIQITHKMYGPFKLTLKREERERERGGGDRERQRRGRIFSRHTLPCR